jgi:hypothetical protein
VQGAQQGMDRCDAVLPPRDVKKPVLKIDRISTQADPFRHTQTVAGDPDQRGVPRHDDRRSPPLSSEFSPIEFARRIGGSSNSGAKID